MGAVGPPHMDVYSIIYNKIYYISCLRTLYRRVEVFPLRKIEGQVFQEDKGLYEILSIIYGTVGSRGQGGVILIGQFVKMCVRVF